VEHNRILILALMLLFCAGLVSAIPATCVHNTVTANVSNGNYDVSYSYLQNGVVYDSTDAINTSLQIIPTGALPLIVMIVMLGIVLSLTLNAFTNKRG
jgi:hypothetical protein